MTLVSFRGEVVGLVEPVVVAPLAAGAADPPLRLRSTVVHPPGCFGAGAGSSALAPFVGFAAAAGPFGFAAGVDGPACLECIREWGGEVKRAAFVVVAGGKEEVVVTGSRPRFAARGGEFRGETLWSSLQAYSFFHCWMLFFSLHVRR